MKNNLQEVIKTLTGLNKLLNRGASLKLEINGTTWYAVRNVEKFEREIWQRNSRRIEKEMFGDLQLVGNEIHPPQSPQIAPEPPKEEKGTLPTPSEIRAIRGKDEDVKDFAEKHKDTLFYDKARGVFVKKI